MQPSIQAQDLEAWFWYLIVGGRPLHVLVIYLPARSPEPNAIKPIFHIFSRHIWSYLICCNDGPVDGALIHYGSMVMNKILYYTILYGYNTVAIEV
jgi:hypothetical protein